MARATPANLRRAQAELTRLAVGDLAALWRQITNAFEARIALQDVLPVLVASYGSASATLAAEWYDQARTEAGAGGSFTAYPASILDDATDALALWATSTGTNLDTIQAMIAGGLQRRILNYGRQTVMGSALADPAADGWQRAGIGECDFCRMLISRGAVYSEATADFGAHDDCQCTAVAAFGGKPRPVRPYKPSLRQSDADKARAKQWIKTHL